MWTSTLQLEPKRVFLSKLLGMFYKNIYYSSLSPLQVENAPRQSLSHARWVRVRNRLAGICGTDLHLIYADADPRVAPAAIPGQKQMFLGHEVVGEVIEIGDEVEHLQVGDRVVLQNGPNCFSAGVTPPCRNCADGNYNLCEYGVLPGPQTIGGGWSEEMLLHEQQLFALPPNLSDEQAVMLEPSAVALHAVLRHLPRAGERVLIIGAGTIGLLTLQILRALAPEAEISVLARYPFQVEQATRMGATHIIYPQDAYTGVQRATKARLYRGFLGNRMLGGGYDIIFDTIGRQRTVHDALRWTRARGTIVLVGLSLHLMHVDLTPIWHQEINLLGSLSHGQEHWPLHSQETRSTFSIAAEMIRQEQIQPEQLITHHFALTNYKDALVTATRKAQSRAIKVVFDYALLPATVVPNVRASARLRRPALHDIGAASSASATPVPTSGVQMPIPTPAKIKEPELPQKKQLETPVPASIRTMPSIDPVSTTIWNYDLDSTDDADEDTATAIPAIRIPRSSQAPTLPPGLIAKENPDSQSFASKAQPIGVSSSQADEMAIPLQARDKSAQSLNGQQHSPFSANAVPATALPAELPTNTLSEDPFPPQEQAETEKHLPLNNEGQKIEHSTSIAQKQVEEADVAAATISPPDEHFATQTQTVSAADPVAPAFRTVPDKKIIEDAETVLELPIPGEQLQQSEQTSLELAVPGEQVAISEQTALELPVPEQSTALPYAETEAFPAVTEANLIRTEENNAAETVGKHSELTVAHEQYLSRANVLQTKSATNDTGKDKSGNGAAFVDENPTVRIQTRHRSRKKKR